MIETAIDQGVITIIKVHGLNITGSKYIKQYFLELQVEIDKF